MQCQPCGVEQCDAAQAASQSPTDELEMQKAALLAEFEAAMSSTLGDRPAGESLMDEIMQDNLPEVQRIIQNDPGCVRYSNLSGQTPLATAVQWARDESCAVLLEAKCDVNAQDDKGRAAVHHLVGDNAQSGHPLLPGLHRCVHTLVDHKADLSLRDGHGSTVLQWLLEEECLETAGCLLEAKASPHDTCGSGSLLNAASSSKRAGSVRLLLEFKARLDVVCENSGMGPLHLAARAGATDIVEVLLEAKADAGMETAHGKTALQLAEVNKQQACVELLLPLAK